MNSETARPNGNELDSKAALLEAARAAVADRELASDRPASRRAGVLRRVFHAALAVVLGVGLGLLVARPVWLAGPALPDEPPEIRAASVTLVLVDAAARLRAFRDARGTLPSRLEDAGVTAAGVRYDRLGDVEFRVAMSAGDSVVTIRSDESLPVLVARAIRTLNQRP